MIEAKFNTDLLLTTPAKVRNRYRLRIKELRESTGLTMSQMARLLHRSRQYLHGIESGKRVPGLGVTLYICEFFGVTLNDLVVLRDDAQDPVNKKNP